MTRPPRKISLGILNTLDRRPRLRYTLTSKGVKAYEMGEAGGNEQYMESLVEAIGANNKQPVSLMTWRRFHHPKKITNQPIKDLIQDRFIRIVSRGKFTFGTE